jgi:hypothetical protein
MLIVLRAIWHFYLQKSNCKMRLLSGISVFRILPWDNSFGVSHSSAHPAIKCWWFLAVLDLEDAGSEQP